MPSVQVVLLLLAFVCFVLAAAGVSSRIALTPLGLAFWALSVLIR